MIQQVLKATIYLFLSSFVLYASDKGNEQLFRYVVDLEQEKGNPLYLQWISPDTPKVLIGTDKNYIETYEISDEKKWKLISSKHLDAQHTDFTSSTDGSLVVGIHDNQCKPNISFYNQTDTPRHIWIEHLRRILCAHQSNQFIAISTHNNQQALSLIESEEKSWNLDGEFIDLSPDDKYIYCYQDSTIVIYDRLQRNKITSLPVGRNMKQALWHPQGNKLLITYKNSPNVKEWDIFQKKVIKTQKNNKCVDFYRYAPNGELFSLNYADELSWITHYKKIKPTAVIPPETMERPSLCDINQCFIIIGTPRSSSLYITKYDKDTQLSHWETETSSQSMLNFWCCVKNPEE